MPTPASTGAVALITAFTSGVSFAAASADGMVRSSAGLLPAAWGLGAGGGGGCGLCLLLLLLLARPAAAACLV